jgi:hypothetical protein
MGMRRLNDVWGCDEHMMTGVPERPSTVERLRGFLYAAKRDWRSHPTDELGRKLVSLAQQEGRGKLADIVRAVITSGEPALITDGGTGAYPAWRAVHGEETETRVVVGVYDLREVGRRIAEDNDKARKLSLCDTRFRMFEEYGPLFSRATPEAERGVLVDILKFPPCGEADRSQTGDEGIRAFFVGLNDSPVMVGRYKSTDSGLVLVEYLNDPSRPAQKIFLAEGPERIEIHRRAPEIAKQVIEYAHTSLCS